MVHRLYSARHDTASTGKEGLYARQNMRHLIDLTAVTALCLFSLFYTEPGIGYVLAFLCAVILCCLDLFLKDRRLTAACCIFFFAAGLFCPEFVFFYPSAAYPLLIDRQWAALLPCPVLFVFLSAKYHLPMVLICLETAVFFIAFLLKYRTFREDFLELALKRTRDDSTERDILLTEKNRSLLEKQDYEIYTATLKERNRIAREIHDNVGHLLSRSILLVGAMKAVNRDQTLTQPLDSLDLTLNSAMDSIRKSVHDLHDDAVNLEESIRSLIRDFSFCPVDFRCDSGKNVPKDVKYSFISITREALSNIMRHSDATRASITIREHPALYQLCIEDNGSSSPKKAGGIGLQNMQERTLALRGHIQISDDHGFKIFITIPKETQT